jgi:hypothetical protein
VFLKIEENCRYSIKPNLEEENNAELLENPNTRRIYKWKMDDIQFKK